MGLIQCPVCKKEVSDEAITCPHCGNLMVKAKTPLNSINCMYIIWYVITTVMTCFSLALILFGLLGDVVFLVGYYFKKKQFENKIVFCTDNVKKAYIAIPIMMVLRIILFIILPFFVSL